MITTLARCAALCFLAGCATAPPGTTYDRSDLNQPQRVEYGEVVMVRLVEIEGERSPIGIAAGGYLGYLLGNEIGAGAGQEIARVAGALAGAVVGSQAEKELRDDVAYELTVELDTGETIVVVQDTDEYMEQGDRVRVIIRGDERARVLQ